METKTNTPRIENDDMLMERWINNRQLIERAKCIQSELETLTSSFASNIQKNEFVNQLRAREYKTAQEHWGKNPCVRTGWCQDSRSWGNLLIGSFYSKSADYIDFGVQCVSSKDLVALLVRQGQDWQNAAIRISEQLSLVMSEARKIQRNILYPEFGELEKEKAELDRTLDEIQDEKNALIINLAQEMFRMSLELTRPDFDKEMADILVKENIINPDSHQFALRRIKEAIKEFQERAEKRAAELEEAIKKAIIKLDRTKSILKSKKIAEIKRELYAVLPGKTQRELGDFGINIPPFRRSWPAPPELGTD